MIYNGSVEEFVQRTLCEYGFVFKTLFSYPVLLCKSSLLANEDGKCPTKNDDDNFCILLKLSDFKKIAKIFSDNFSVDDAESFLTFCQNNNEFIMGSKSEKYPVNLMENLSVLDFPNDELQGKKYILRFLLVATAYLFRKNAQKDDFFKVFDLKANPHLKKHCSVQQALNSLREQGLLTFLEDEEFKILRINFSEILSATYEYCVIVEPKLNKNTCEIEQFIVSSFGDSLHAHSDFSTPKL